MYLNPYEFIVTYNVNFSYKSFGICASRKTSFYKGTQSKKSTTCKIGHVKIKPSQQNLARNISS